MEISHVIRAEEHLSNTPRQIFIAQSLDYNVPEHGHIPYVAEPNSDRKLSKRHIDKYRLDPTFKKIQEMGESIMTRLGREFDPCNFNPVLVNFYKKLGYLPAAVVNGLLMLGWAYDDKKEIFSQKEMIDLFSLEKVNKSPARFDPTKLTTRFQEHYAAELPAEQKAALARPYLEEVGLLSHPPTLDELERLYDVAVAAGDRLKISGQILDFDDFFVKDENLKYDEKAFEKRIRKPEKAVELLKNFRAELEQADEFEAESLEALMKSFVEKEGIKIGDIIHAVRVAVTGKGVGCGMFETLAILGKEQCLNRMDRALSMV